jgi:hypothetical protein
MSKLILTRFDKNVQNSVKSFEESGKPKVGEMVFIYLSDKSNNSIDESNKSIIMKSMGWSKINKFNNYTTNQTKAMSKNGSSDFNESRTKEIEKTYDYLADTFLKLLHDATWTHYGNVGGVEKYILSTIDYTDAYEDIKLVIESMEIFKMKCVNDKFNEEYSKIEIENAMK